MNITVQEAMTIYPLSEGKIVAGAGGISRIISALNLMDAPDIYNWMKQGELLLTTGYAMKDSSELFVELLHNLNERGSSGLGIKLGRYWKEIPSTVLKEADRLNFPLIELPFEVTFSEQITALFQAQYERNTKKLNQVLDIQKQLVDFALQANERSNYFEEIQAILQCPFAVVDVLGNLLYNATSVSEKDLLSQWPWEPEYRLSRLLGQLTYHIPLWKNSQLLGYFLVMSSSLRNTSSDKGVYHQAAVILSYHLEEIQLHQTLTVGLRLGEAIERYLQGSLSLDEVGERAKRLSGDIWKGAYLCIVTPLNEMSLHEQVQKKVFIRQLQDAMKDAPPLTELISHHMFVHSKLFSLIQIPDKLGANLTTMKRIASSYSQLLRVLLNCSPSSYISSMKRTLENFMVGYEECMEAQRLSEQFAIDEPDIYFSNLEFTYLLRHVPATVMNTYTNTLLQPLWQKDEEYITEMLRTIGSYFEHNGLINETAKDLYIHRNTVLYRLEKIGELLHLDLKNPNDLLRIKLALLFKQLL
ncbi:hypothetical protein GC096_17235 [Paenibacillus sp. LMG 31461]|uniref:PucR family transcriptional regulator n=1 Tax=Paenibacillus plantarum TaxID=2654975 RepID=A0ABX1XBG8_9BACL|nr:PucR family transcriptional regulator [Paenibacillus plantarum]NOU65782.1 hypothetical protein [Paenibacillus plantarum]